MAGTRCAACGCLWCWCRTTLTPFWASPTLSLLLVSQTNVSFCGTNGSYSSRYRAGSALLRWQVRLLLLDVRSTVPSLILVILLCLLVAADQWMNCGLNCSPFIQISAVLTALSLVSLQSEWAWFVDMGWFAWGPQKGRIISGGKKRWRERERERDRVLLWCETEYWIEEMVKQLLSGSAYGWVFGVMMWNGVLNRKDDDMWVFPHISMRLHGVTSQKTVIFMNMPLAYLYETWKPETLDNSCNTLVCYTEEFFSSRPKPK